MSRLTEIFDGVPSPAKNTFEMDLERGQPNNNYEDIGALTEYAWSPTQSDDSFSNLPERKPCNAIGELHERMFENQRNISSISSSGDTMDFVNNADKYSSDSLESSLGFLAQNGAPYLDIPIRGGAFGSSPHSEPLSSSQHEPSIESRPLSRVILSRFSGIVTDRSSERYMNHAEIEESLLLFDNPGRVPNSGVTVPELPNSSYVTGESDSRDFSTRNPDEGLEPNQNKANVTIQGPGSSQTSSSISRRGISGGLTGGGALDISSNDSNPLTTRSPTPNLLWGRRAMKPTDSEWETVSEFKRISDSVVGKASSEAQTGSSLANNSDSDEVSLNKCAQPPRLNTTHHNSQQTVQPRPNQNFLFVKNNQTGRIDCLPQQRFEEEGDRTFNSGPSRALPSVNTAITEYRHPAPLTTIHTHPLLSPSPVIRLARNMTTDTRSPLSQPTAFTASSSSESSFNVVTAANTDDQSVTEGGRGASGSSEEERREYGRENKARSIHSSAWLSTVSEGESANDSLRDCREREGSFAKVTVLGSKGNITGTPEGTGAREVGSSIADASSQGAKFSSPAPFGRSPCSPSPQAHSHLQTLDDPFATTPQHDRSAYKNTLPGTPLYAHSYHSASGNPFSTPRSSSVSLTGSGALSFPNASIDAVNIAMQDRGDRTARRVRRNRKSSPRSSSESEARVTASSKTWKASGLPSPIVMGHRHRKTATGVVQRETFMRSDSDISRDGTADTAPTVDYLASAYVVRPWDSSSAHSRPSPQSSPFTRPIARAESPHLHRVPRQPTPEIASRQKQISFWFLVPTCAVPPMALLYGYGLMDGVIGQATSGEIHHFDEWYKFFARCWGFGVTGAIILSCVVAMLVISA